MIIAIASQKGGVGKTSTIDHREARLKTELDPIAKDFDYVMSVRDGCVLGQCHETNAGTIAAGLCQVCSLVPRSTVQF